jgi:hypothetical protein
LTPFCASAARIALRSLTSTMRMERSIRLWPTTIAWACIRLKVSASPCSARTRAISLRVSRSHLPLARDLALGGSQFSDGFGHVDVPSWFVLYAFRRNLSCVPWRGEKVVAAVPNS